MNIETKIDELRKVVSKYDTESFAGFFAYFIRKRPNDLVEIELNKFESKLKDFLYLIALNAFSSEKGDEKFEQSDKILGDLAAKVNEIKNFYHVEKCSDYTQEAIIHELAFRNHFDNGVLSYVEQDLEKIKAVFLPFEDKIIEDFGIDVDFLIDVYKQGELISRIRFAYVMEFFQTKEFEEFNKNVHSGGMNFSKAFDLLPKSIQDAFLAFHSKTYAYLMFTKEDLYHTLPKEKVDKFLELFSCEPNPNINFRYYAADNPFEFAPILKLSENSYLNLYQKQIPIAIYKRLYDHLLKDKWYNEKVRKHRETSLEKKVLKIFKSFFPSKEAFFYENYFVDNNCEQDLLIIFKGIAIIVETKASKLREPFRDVQKAVCRLEDDFKDSIQYGYNQCKRVEDYFFDTKPFDIRDNKGQVLYRVNPNKIHSFYSIVVTLERFGSLQTDLGIMLQKEDDEDYPWSVYIDDLEIFLLALKHHIGNPRSKFLDFLRLRQQLHNHIYAIDELDICASYIRDPIKFAHCAKAKDTLITFSPHEQALFDEIYFAGGLRFEERL